jgi:CRP-like cAMP-binding protein
MAGEVSAVGVLTGEELAHEPFLRGMRKADLTRLATAGRRVTIPAAQRMCAEGRPAERFWLIDGGTVTVDRLLPDRCSIVETLGPGSVLGWSWLFQPRRWAHGAVASTRVDAIEFDARLVRTLCAVDTALGYELTRRFAELVVARLRAAGGSGGTTDQGSGTAVRHVRTLRMPGRRVDQAADQ